MEDCIVSISTPLGKGAVAIVRMSGKGALDIALKLFHGNFFSKQEIQPRLMYLGQFELDPNTFEQCFMVFFKAPYSYTGEDIVEFQIHGGVMLAQKVVEACLKNGARMALPGEYSKRAFLNGKITLDKAEAIIGEINAESEGELRSSLQITNGKLSQEVEFLQSELSQMLAEVEVGMDYPDETEELGLKLNIFERLEQIEKKLEDILENSQSATYLSNGVNVALVGKTNVGKSSVLNALLGKERAIVTEIQGTTRDSIVDSYVFKGVKFNITDTAGIRETLDVVENIGIEKSKETLSLADVVLFVVDGSQKKSQEDKQIEKLLSNKETIVVVNKTDLPRKFEIDKNQIEISALTGKNISQLKSKIYDLVIQKEIDFNHLVVTNQRQNQILNDSKRKIDEILKNTEISLDVLSMLLKKVWMTLGKITGNTENEDIIDLIFSKFCLGK